MSLIYYEKAIRLIKNKKVIALRTREWASRWDLGSKYTPGGGLAELDVEVPLSLDEIRNLAYYKWEEAGCPMGRDTEFWLAAEQTVKIETYQVVTSSCSFELRKLYAENKIA